MPRLYQEIGESLRPYQEAQRAFRGISYLMPSVITPSTTNRLEGPTKRIEEETAAFQSAYFASHPEKQGDEKVTGLFGDMNNAGYWHILGRIDGNDQGMRPFNPYTSKQLEEGRQTREWAKETFTQEELQKVLEIVTDTALMGVYSDMPQPGFRLGHGILYSHLFLKPDSMFASLPTDALKARLNNGRFWENLAELNFTQDEHADHVGDVLSNFNDDLDPDFFEQGYEIFRRNGGEHFSLVPELSALTPDEITAYWVFVQQLDQEVYANKDKKAHEKAASEARGWENYLMYYGAPSDTDARIAYLIRPYLHSVHAKSRRNYQDEVGEFDGQEIAEQLEQPILQKYLDKSELIRESLANDLQDYLTEDTDLAAAILSHIPKPREMIARLIAKARSPKKDRITSSKKQQLKGIDKLLRKTGIGLSELLDPNDTPLLKPVEA